MGDLIRLEDLHIDFDSVDGLVHVLRGVNIALGRGEKVALVGESGSGKSVTARAILGLLNPRRSRLRGRILFDGRNILGEPAARSRDRRGRDITMIFQDPVAALNPVYTIRNQFAAVLERGRGRIPWQEAEDVMTNALREVAITDPVRVLDSYSFQLSGGLNQRVMIAMGLVNRPRLLIADEPGTALDVTVQQQTLHIMRNLTEASGTAILFISHNLGVVRQFVDRVCVMYAGAIVEDAPVAEIFARPRHPYTQALLASVPRLSTPRLPSPIPGMVPDPRTVLPGCSFHPRCAFGRPDCLKPVPRTETTPGHFLTCIHAKGAGA